MTAEEAAARLKEKKSLIKKPMRWRRAAGMLIILLPQNLLKGCL